MPNRSWLISGYFYLAAVFDREFNDQPEMRLVIERFG